MPCGRRMPATIARTRGRCSTEERGATGMIHLHPWVRALALVGVIAGSTSPVQAQATQFDNDATFDTRAFREAERDFRGKLITGKDITGFSDKRMAEISNLVARYYINRLSWKEIQAGKS